MTVEEKARSNFRDYDNYSRRLHQIPHYQILALRRGKGDSDELTVKVNIVSDAAVVALMHKLLEKFNIQHGRVHALVDDTKYTEFSGWFNGTKSSAGDKPIFVDRDRVVGEVVCEAARNHLIKSITNELWKSSLKKAEQQALVVFSTNLHKILMIPPLSRFIPNATVSCNICGIDPGQRNGHKLAFLDASQKLIDRAGYIYIYVTLVDSMLND